MMTVSALLLVLAVIFLAVSATGRMPLWPALLCVILERIIAVGGGVVR
jgi:hypothetical protein